MRYEPDPRYRITPIRIIGGLLALFLVTVASVLEKLDPPPPR